MTPNARTQNENKTSLMNNDHLKQIYNYIDLQTQNDLIATFMNYALLH